MTLHLELPLHRVGRPVAENPLRPVKVGVVEAHLLRRLEVDSRRIKGLLVLPPAHVANETRVIADDPLPPADDGYSFALPAHLQPVQLKVLRVRNDRLSRRSLSPRVGVIVPRIQGRCPFPLRQEAKAF